MSYRRVASLPHCVFIGLLLFPVLAATDTEAGLSFNRSVGGITIDADGVVGETQPETRSELVQAMEATLGSAPAALGKETQLRRISLRRLEAVLANAEQNKSGQLPAEVRYLAGLTRVEFIFVHPEQNDIVLAGPGEDWRINRQGAVVGKHSGRPLLQLDDLLVAFRSAESARQVGISCSIDPTDSGRRALQQYLDQQEQFHPRMTRGIERAMGPQTITITGIPASSHFARVMVASDYRMKRIAMNLEPAPILGLPGFLDLLTARTARFGNLMPRWWLACNYEPLGRSEDGLAWQLRGTGVKAMTENDLVDQDGTTKTSGRVNPVAQKWANLMTTKFEELATEDAVFGELRNLMDLSVVAALIRKEHLLEKADCQLPLLFDADVRKGINSWPIPKLVSTRSSFIKKGNNVVVTASGGVQIESWQVVQKSEADPEVGQLRSAGAPPQNDHWFWQ